MVVTIPPGAITDALKQYLKKNGLKIAATVLVGSAALGYTGRAVVNQVKHDLAPRSQLEARCEMYEHDITGDGLADIEILTKKGAYALINTDDDHYVLATALVRDGTPFYKTDDGVYTSKGVYLPGPAGKTPSNGLALSETQYGFQTPDGKFVSHDDAAKKTDQKVK